MFTAALFTIAKIWTQPKCPRDEWIKKMNIYIYIYTYIYIYIYIYITRILLSHKKE